MTDATQQPTDPQDQGSAIPAPPREGLVAPEGVNTGSADEVREASGSPASAVPGDPATELPAGSPS